MKWYHGITLFIIGILIGGGGWAYIDYKFFPCPVAGISVDPQPQGKPTPNPDAPNPYACGRDIIINGMMYENSVFRATAYTDCLSAYRDFKLTYNCPTPKYSIMLSALAGVGYMPDKTFDALVGGELEILRHWKLLSVGGGIWYMQGLFTDFKAGGVKATLYFNI
jgi:hypothetical protein